MNSVKKFDVLIVYSGSLADSASSISGKISAPFSKESGKENYNIVYSYFLEDCWKNNLKAAFSTSSDIIGTGMVKSYWIFEDKVWKRIQGKGYSKIIFDKFSPTNKEKVTKRDLLFSSKKIRPFNRPSLFDLCFDKQKTYNKLSKFAIPTVTIKSVTKKGIHDAVSLLGKEIVKHKHEGDFSNKIVMKDRFGAGGINVYKFEAGQEDLMSVLIKKHKNISFIIQPLVEFDKGFIYKNSSVSTDIRLIYLGSTLVQTYIRMAKKGSFRCNEHSGGLLKYIQTNEIPLKVLSASHDVAKIIDNKSSLIALDFIVSNRGNVYLLEANSGPGLDWNLSMKENEVEAKKLIRVIIKEIVKRTGISNTSLKRKNAASIDNVSDYSVTPNILITV